MAEIGDHAARHLVQIGLVVVFGRRADRKPSRLATTLKCSLDRAQHLLVDDRLVAERAQIVRDVEDRRQRRAVGERRHAGVHDPDAEPHRFERDQRPQARWCNGCAARPECRPRSSSIDRHQRAHALGREQAARVLEAEPERRERHRLPAALRRSIRRCERARPSRSG